LISGFGIVSVTGRSLLPRPPDSIMAFIKKVNFKLH